VTNPPLEAIVVGASAGAIGALSVILTPLPLNFPLPILIVVHQPIEPRSVIAELFQQKCALVVREAEDKVPIEGGIITFAPPDYHLLVEPERLLSLSSEEPVNYSRPSIDVLFETAADAFGTGLLGVVLTGANHDGAAGLKCIMEAGGLGLVQRPELAYASAMPQAALEACPQARRLSLDEIAVFLQGLASS
jgi:two-component system, chemotaxis family, protein-glutamate methylesterase/glutaminase